MSRIDHKTIFAADRTLSRSTCIVVAGEHQRRNFTFFIKSRLLFQGILSVLTSTLVCTSKSHAKRATLHVFTLIPTTDSLGQGRGGAPYPNLIKLEKKKCQSSHITPNVCIVILRRCQIQIHSNVSINSNFILTKIYKDISCKGID